MRVKDITDGYLQEYVRGTLCRVAGDTILECVEEVCLPVEVSPALIAVCSAELAAYRAVNPSPVYDFFEIPSQSGDFDPNFPLCSVLGLVIETYGV